MTATVRLMLGELSQMRFSWSGKQMCCLCSVLFPSLWDLLHTSWAPHVGYILFSVFAQSLSTLGPLLFLALAFLGSLNLTTSPHCLLPSSHFLLLCLWSLRTQLPSELAPLNILFWFVCDTQPAVGLSSGEPKNAFLGQHPVFVKLLCRKTAEKEAHLAHVFGNEVFTSMQRVDKINIRHFTHPPGWSYVILLIKNVFLALPISQWS